MENLLSSLCIVFDFHTTQEMKLPFGPNNINLEYAEASSYVALPKPHVYAKT